ncbi:MAG TPA: peptidase M16 [Desulfobacteraceae bacterium]|nr:peptidase M16 [Desulfobacteraceae bacterium]
MPEHGFILKWDKTIQELAARAVFYVHERTGAELLSIVNNDENKVFGVTFRTPPTDSTGVAHILEHSVLCGSRKYPVKEPFVELLKGSLQTFLNAFTYPDRTCYPVASQHIEDFYNLVDVYLDAVFYPRLTPQIFMQEGWHYEFDPEEGLSLKGVVYNEMKGAYSSPDNLLAEYSLQSIFPDTPYGLDSGGDPKVIPELTFEQFSSFHSRFYHPSNARFYFCGDDPSDRRLAVLDEYLREFDHLHVDSSIPAQPRFSAPKRLTRSFAAGEQEPSAPRGMVTVNWLLSENTDVDANFSMHVLEYILLGMPGSPLRKALIDSGLGEDLAGEGLGAELRQSYFSTGLKGVRLEKLEAVEPLVLQTLASLAENGIDPETIEAALNTIEFKLRENNTGRFPRGLILMLRAVTSWLYGGDPTALLAFEGPLEKVKTASGKPGFFENLIRTMFLENQHRTTLLLTPDPKLGAAEEAAEKQRLAGIRAHMNSEQLEKISQAAAELEKLQQSPDPPEALASIPVLKREDLEPYNKKIPCENFSIEGIPALYHELFTSGIVYLDIGFDLHMLPASYIPFIPFFGRCLVEIGTEKEDFSSLGSRISRITGGISPHTLTASLRGSHQCAGWLFLRTKAVESRLHELADLLKDILLRMNLDNKGRFTQMLLEEKARLEESLIPGGHQVVSTRLRAHFNEAGNAAEQMGGVSQLFFLRELVERVKNDWPSVLEALEDIRRTLINRRAAIINITAGSWNEAGETAASILASIPECPVGRTEWNWPRTAPFETLTIPSQVNYIGKAMNLFEFGYTFSGSSLVITRYLRNSWLWDRIRVQGGAYGAFCALDRFSGVLTFVSYRDPQADRTIEVFDGAAAYLESLVLNERELTKSIIGAIGDIDAHMLPDAKGFSSLARHLTGDDEDLRRKMRNEVLNTESRHFREFGEMLDDARKRGIVVALGSPSSLRERLNRGPGQPTEIKVL